eukprot:TRINITY_DN9562_c0_g1_i1.p1 TRINITY_DN9562_c0_g1~~TRINITY_DN9562_c0_g1_i1.p1  ORF type:complete len:215 (-),score=61.06 TRINITY_DN9562_c0_g1_i1:52-696(-)
MRTRLSVLILTLCWGLARAAAATSMSDIAPGAQLFGLAVTVDGPPLLFRVRAADLAPGISYEVKVSYAATTPATFALRFLPVPVAESGSAPPRQPRTLLNVEKLEFRTALGGGIAGGDHLRFVAESAAEPDVYYVLEVLARSSAVRAPSAAAPQRVLFNLELAPLRLGVLPADLAVARVGIAVIVLVLVWIAVLMCVCTPQRLSRLLVRDGKSM